MCIMFHHIIYIWYSNIIILQVCDEGWCSRSKPWMLKKINIKKNYIFKEFRTFWSGFFLFIVILEDTRCHGEIHWQKETLWLLYIFFKINYIDCEAHILHLTLSTFYSLSNFIQLILLLMPNNGNIQLNKYKIYKKKNHPPTFYFLGQFYIMLMVLF